MTVRPPLVVAAALLAMAAAGCGQSEDRDQVRDVAARFSAALADGDGDAACALLDQPARAALEQQERAPCAEAIGELELRPGLVAQVRVFVTNAQVRLGGGEVAYLGRWREGWRFSAVGCRFEDGKPRSRPATCQLES
jgi:hypothetical protein